MARKYLNDIGVDDTLMNIGLDDDRWERWQDEIKEYGFPSYETWALDRAFYGWLYERLKRFLEVNCIRLDYHKFMYEGREYTQGELIDEMIRKCELFFAGPPYTRGNIIEGIDSWSKEIGDIAKMWALVIPTMWW